METVSVERMNFQRQAITSVVTFWLALDATSLASTSQITGNEECSIWTNGICLPKDYNKLMPPGKPMTIKASIRIEQVRGIDDSKSEIDLFGYFTFYWTEQRLQCSNHSMQPKQGESGLPLSTHWIDWLWVPDIYIYQMISENRPGLLQPFISLSKYYFIDNW